MRDLAQSRSADTRGAKCRRRNATIGAAGVSWAITLYGEESPGSIGQDGR